MAQRGRPAVFIGNVEARIVGLIQKFGLTGARAKLAGYKKPISVSLPTLGKLAERNSVELKRGRRAA